MWTSRALSFRCAGIAQRDSDGLRASRRDLLSFVRRRRNSNARGRRFSSVSDLPKPHFDCRRARSPTPTPPWPTSERSAGTPTRPAMVPEAQEGARRSTPPGARAEPSRPRGIPAAAACDHRRHSRATVPLRHPRRPSRATTPQTRTTGPPRDRRRVREGRRRRRLRRLRSRGRRRRSPPAPLVQRPPPPLLRRGHRRYLRRRPRDQSRGPPARRRPSRARQRHLQPHGRQRHPPHGDDLHGARAARSRHGQAPRRFDLVARLPDERLRPKLRTMAPAMHAFAAAGDIDGAMEVCAALAAANIERGEAEYAALLSAHRAAGRWDDGWNLLREMREEVRTLGEGLAEETRAFVSAAPGWSLEATVEVNESRARVCRRRETRQLAAATYPPPIAPRCSRASANSRGNARLGIPSRGSRGGWREGTAAVSRRRSQRRDVQSKFQAERVQLQPGGTRHGEHQDQGEGGAEGQARGERGAQDENARARGEGER